MQVRGADELRGLAVSMGGHAACRVLDETPPTKARDGVHEAGNASRKRERDIFMDGEDEAVPASPKANP